MWSWWWSTGSPLMDRHVPFFFSRASQVAWPTKVTLQETGRGVEQEQ